MTQQALLRAELNEYMKTIGDLSPAEKQDLRTWVAGGNSGYDNPFLLYGEDGWPMDYVNASRVNDDMYEDFINSSNSYQFEFEPNEKPDNIPF